MQRKSAEISIQKQKVTQQQSDLIQESINSLSYDMGNQMNSSVYEKMKESAEQCGLTFEIPPSGISIEQYFDIITQQIFLPRFRFSTMVSTRQTSHNFSKLLFHSS